MPGAIRRLAAAVLAFLDTDAVWGPTHPRTRATKQALHDATAAVLHEEHAIDVERPALEVLDGGLRSAG